MLAFFSEFPFFDSFSDWNITFFCLEVRSFYLHRHKFGQQLFDTIEERKTGHSIAPPQFKKAKKKPCLFYTFSNANETEIEFRN